MTYVVKFMDGSYMIVTEDQAQTISDTQNSGAAKSLKVNNQFITINQVTGIETLEVFRRGVKHKLAARNLRMCRRCHEILPRMGDCPCEDKPEKYPDILAVAREENPKLAAALDRIALLKSADKKTDSE